MVSSKYLVCIDSDGCAIDSMNVKHFKCFGPIAVTEWELESIEKEFLNRWNEINLYSETRGINRFLGLAIIAEEYKLFGCQAIKDWTKRTKSLSNDALSSETDPGLKKLLSWSIKVNEAIELLEMPQPFNGVKEVIDFLASESDIAIVSSANLDAIKNEWTTGNLMDKVSFVMSQKDGSKSHCIASLISKGYDKSKILMIGDSPGDYEAANDNNISFYPITPGKEVESWETLKNQGWEEFKLGMLNPSYVMAFNNSLGMS